MPEPDFTYGKKLSKNVKKVAAILIINHPNYLSSQVFIIIAPSKNEFLKITP